MSTDLILVGNPDDLVQDEQDLPAIERYEGMMFTHLRTVLGQDDRALHALVLTHHDMWTDWNSPVAKERKPGALYDFSFTASIVSLVAHTESLWWPGALGRVFVAVHPAYREIAEKALAHQGLDLKAYIATGTPRQQVKQLKEWLVGHMPEPRMRRWIVTVREKHSAMISIRGVWSTHPGEAQRIALNQVFAEKGWHSITADVPLDADEIRVGMAKDLNDMMEKTA